MTLGLRTSAHMARANNRHLARAGVVSNALQSVDGSSTAAGTGAAVTPAAPTTNPSKASSSPPATPSPSNTTPDTPATPTTPAPTKPTASVSTPASNSQSTTKSTTSTTSTTASSSSPAVGGAQTINDAPGTIAGASPVAGAGVGGVTTTPATAPSFALPATSSTSATAASSSPSTTTIIIIAAGGLIGIVIAIAAVSFILRRCRNKRRDDALGEAFDRSEFKRNSVVLGDEAVSERSKPRPPTMIDRHLNRPAASSNGHGGYSAYDHPAQQHQQQQQGYYPQQAAYPDYPDYGQQHGQQFQGGGYYHGEALPPSMSQYESPAQSPIGDHFSEHHATGPQYVNHQVNFAGAGAGAAGRSLTRHMSDDSTVVADLGRGHSVTPFQAVQYAEISRRLTDGSDGPTDPAQAYARLDRQPTSGQHGRAPVHPAAYEHAQYHGRPTSQYDAEDAYGGI